MKVSVILTTNRQNKYIYRYIRKIKNRLKHEDDNARIFTDEFIKLAKDRVDDCTHILEPTLNSLKNQTFDDFELIISHRYPDDAIGIVKNYDYPIRLVKEKHSIWHDLGVQYQTVANNKNNGLIHANGELIWHIDDLIIFNDDAVKEAWDLYQQGKYMTGRSFRCIRYDKDYEDGYEQLGPMKTAITKNGWRGEQKPLSYDMTQHPQIPMSMFWTCSATASLEEMFEINGYDEIYDGSLAGIDMDAGTRLEKISTYTRVASDNYIYEFDDPSPKPQIRNDVMMRAIFGQTPPIGPINVKANSWKPAKPQMNRYERWHKKTYGSLDKNWDMFMNVPYIDLRNENNNCNSSKLQKA